MRPALLALLLSAGSARGSDVRASTRPEPSPPSPRAQEAGGLLPKAAHRHGPVDAAVDPLPASPIYAISASSALNRTADHFLAEAEGCDASTSWTTCATVDADPAHCAPEAVLRRARDRWPSLRSELDLVAGPVRAMHGIAWRGQTRHLTRDLHARTAVLLQYGTEECVRSLRGIRVPVDIRKRWRTTDWLPFVQVPVGGLEPGARSPLSRPHPLDHLFLGRAAEEEGLQCQRREPTWFTSHGTTPHRAGILAVRPSDFEAEPTWVSGGARVRHWRRSVSTPHLALLLAQRTRWIRGGGQAHPPLTERTDELCVALSGAVDYALGTAGECGKYSLVSAVRGFVSFLPAGVYHTCSSSPRSDGDELCFKWVTSNRSSAVADRLSAQPHRNFSGAELRAVVPAASAADRLCAAPNVPLTGGAEPAQGAAFETPLWRMGGRAQPELGYAHHLAKVLTMGGGFSYKQHRDSYDLLVVPLRGATTVRSGPGPPVDLEPGSFALVPAGTPHGFARRERRGRALRRDRERVGSSQSRKEPAESTVFRVDQKPSCVCCCRLAL